MRVRRVTRQQNVIPRRHSPREPREQPGVDHERPRHGSTDLILRLFRVRQSLRPRRPRQSPVRRRPSAVASPAPPARRPKRRVRVAPPSSSSSALSRAPPWRRRVVASSRAPRGRSPSSPPAPKNASSAVPWASSRTRAPRTPSRASTEASAASAAASARRDRSSDADAGDDAGVSQRGHRE